MNSVVVTGASSGIGQKTAMQLSRAGYFVYLCGRNESRLDETQSLLKSPENSLIAVADVANVTGCDSLIQLVRKHNSKHPLISLVNNAGIFHRQPFVETPDEIWESQFATNLMSAIRLSRGLVNLLQEVPGSSIINVSSSLGLRPAPNTSAYSAIKAAMISLTETLALELAPRVRVNCVAPGLTHTPIHDFWGNETPGLMQQLNSAQPMNRMGKPEEIAKAIEYLVSDSSAWTTGTTLKIDGGISL